MCIRDRSRYDVLAEAEGLGALSEHRPLEDREGDDPITDPTRQEHERREDQSESPGREIAHGVVSASA
jgi:hypothetical protein